MKTSKVALATLVLALAQFQILPSVAWAESAPELYRAKCAVCHGMTGRADTPMAKKQNIPAFGSERVRKQTNVEIADFILNGGTEKKSSHAWAHKGFSTEDGTKLAAYVKQLGSTK
jgi:mono/diheme cytochrome c family protein